MIKGHLQGHPIYWDKLSQAWLYVDDNTPTKDHWEKRPCGRCGRLVTANGHDPCIANLPGVRNACCGHGEEVGAYVQFDDGRRVSGAAALAVFRDHGHCVPKRLMTEH